MSRIFYFFIFIVLNQSCTSPNKTDKELDSHPNYLIIYTDDLGYADIAPFNDQIKYATPNLSKMAEEGMKFTSMYVSSPACSPSRASLLTGRQPFRMGINAVFYPSSWTGLPTSETTLAEILQENGYVTGVSGKWHLGHRQEYLPLQRGFDEFFGIPYSNGMETLGYIEGNEIVDYNIYQALFTKTFTENTLEFLEIHPNRKV